MRKPEDLTGRKFGRLTPVKVHARENKFNNAHWLCRCDCGNHVVVRSDNLKASHSTQCSECAKNRGRGSVFVKEVMENDDQI
jgi:hypothetical protein